MPNKTEQGKVQAKIQLITSKSESNSDQIQLIIPQDQYGKFQEYKNIGKNGNVIDQEFYAGFELSDKELYVIGSFPQEKVEGNVHLSISSVGTQGNGQPATSLQKMKDKLSLNGKSEVEVNISKHFIKESKDNADALLQKKKEIEALEAEKQKAEQKNKELEAEKKETEEKQQQLIEQLNALQEKEEDTAKLKEHLNELKVQINSLQEQLSKISETKKKELEDAKQEAEEEKTNLQTQLNEALQKLEKTEELKSAFIAHLKKEGEESRRQVQEIHKLVGKLQEENEEQETAVQELFQGLDRINESLETEELNAEVIEELDRLYKEKEKIIAKLIVGSLNKNTPSGELAGKEEQINILNAQVANLQQQLEAKGQEIAQLKQQQPNAKVQELEKELATQKSQVQQLQKEKKELEAQKQPTEQLKASTYTATVCAGLTAGLITFIALEHTVRLDIWTMVGIVAAALAASCGIYFALKPSTQVNKAETQEVNNNALEKQLT